MAVTKLAERRVEKVWGRRDLPDAFGGHYRGQEPLGEIWFEHEGAADLALLVKYLFTSQKLSIQVHPDDEAAARAGHRSGKDEAWIVLKAEAEAVIGTGLRRKVSPEELRMAALDGSIEDLVDWRPARAGDVYHSPAGTVHALGPGLTLVEIQQNVDLTYRLYDYGRPRELHLEQGIAAADPTSHAKPQTPRIRAEGREILVEGGAFVLERWTTAGPLELLAAKERPVWLIPLRGAGAAGSERWAQGEVWLADGPAAISLDEGSELLIAYSPGKAGDDLVR